MHEVVTVYALTDGSDSVAVLTTYDDMRKLFDDKSIERPIRAHVDSPPSSPSWRVCFTAS